jgi:hypothetical protein
MNLINCQDISEQNGGKFEKVGQNTELFIFKQINFVAVFRKYSVFCGFEIGQTN